MNRNRRNTAGASEVAQAQYERRDIARRDIVDYGILVQESRNTMSALEYLRSHDIDPEVIARVLLEPRLRRGVPCS
ncbi:hypothetical protein [Massilia glaciei]|uniref:Uncharacterized protein n=1 Tax=Massilia glaciei TaxID=1524097 RepID=A0A2U2HE96_9BURK|nr:hypothetical protein [Massilia glaciei]PWF41745.1 hypothetical protein C7C56_024035 [Massilia glaciei]